jgi:hypothetical protein
MAAASGLGGNDKTNWASQSQNANGIVLDDAKKFRRNRASDAGLEDAVPGVLSGMYDPAKQSNGNGNARGNATAMAAQQNWRNVNGLNQNQGQGQTQQTQNSPLPPSTASMHSPDLSNLANLAAMQGMQSPQVAMANLLAAQQQIQQQMQLQQMMGMAGMSSPMNMNMMSALQNQQMLSPGERARSFGCYSRRLTPSCSPRPVRDDGHAPIGLLQQLSPGPGSVAGPALAAPASLERRIPERRRVRRCRRRLQASQRHCTRRPRLGRQPGRGN